MAAYLCGVVAVTYLASRIAPAVLLKCGLWIVTAGLLCLGTAPTTSQVMIGTALAGFGGAGIWLTMPVIATADVPVAKRGAVMGSLTATMAVGSIFIPFATSALRDAVNDAGAWREKKPPKLLAMWVSLHKVAALALISLSVAKSAALIIAAW